jgi:hypothetical protein
VVLADVDPELIDRASLSTPRVPEGVIVKLGATILV